LQALIINKNLVKWSLWFEDVQQLIKQGNKSIYKLPLWMPDSNIQQLGFDLGFFMLG
jgi:hypothetical protein